MLIVSSTNHQPHRFRKDSPNNNMQATGIVAVLTVSIIAAMLIVFCGLILYWTGCCRNPLESSHGRWEVGV